MLRLPNELLLAIAEELEHEADVNSMARASLQLFYCLDSFLYRQNARKFDCAALMWAAKHGREDTAQKALRYAKTSAGDALELSAANGHEELTKSLLNICIDQGEKTRVYRQNAAIRASAKGHISIVELLLETGDISVNCRDQRGRTPLSYAVSGGHESVVELLMRSTCIDVDLGDHSGQSPLSYAAFQRRESIVRILLNSNRANVVLRDFDDRTPLS